MLNFLTILLGGVSFTAAMNTGALAKGSRDCQLESAENGFFCSSTATGNYNVSAMLNQTESDVDLQLATKWDFFEAVDSGNTDKVEELLKFKADVNMFERNGFSALRLAAMHGNVDTLKVLLRANAEVNHVDLSSGRTALIEAVIVRNFEIVKVLLEAGANANHRSSFGISALRSAAENGSASIFKELVNFKADVNQVGLGGVSPFLLAVMRGNADIVRFSLKAGADVNQFNNRKETALIKAAVERNCEMSKILIAARADVNHVDDDGFSALKVAVDQNNSELVDLLIFSRADTERVSRYEIVKKAIKKKNDMKKESNHFVSMFGFFQTLPDNSTSAVFEIVKDTVEVSLLDPLIFT